MQWWHDQSPKRKKIIIGAAIGGVLLLVLIIVLATTLGKGSGDNPAPSPPPSTSNPFKVKSQQKRFGQWNIQIQRDRSMNVASDVKETEHNMYYEDLNLEMVPSGYYSSRLKMGE